MKVYVAGSSDEIERAEWAIRELRGAGITVTFDWTEVVRKESGGNPVDATQIQKAQWASRDLDGVAEADVFWLLTPKRSSAGAWCEFGYALATPSRPLIYASPMPRSIFGGLASCYETDELVLEELLRLSRIE